MPLVLYASKQLEYCPSNGTIGGVAPSGLHDSLPYTL